MRSITFLEAERATIYAICLRVLRHPQDAEDACQEALLEAARQAESVRDERKLSAWIRRVATTTALDFRRRRERRRTHETRVRPSEPASAGELDVRGALQKLEEPERRAVEAHYLDGRPLRELAREQGVSEVAVWKRLGKAKSKLRLILAAALPAAIIAASLLVALLRPSTPAPAVPQEEREPWPWELPPKDWPEPVKKSWKALQKRVTIDMDNAPTLDLLAWVGEMIGQPIKVAPGALVVEEIVSFKVADIQADGALTLALQPRGLGFILKDDGTIWVDKKEKLDPNTGRGGEKTIRDVHRIETSKHWHGLTRPLASGRERLATRVEGPSGTLALDDYLFRLRETSGAPLLLEANQADGRAEVVGFPERLSLQAQLRRSLAPLDLEAVPTPSGTILLTRSARAAELRTSPAYLAHERLEAALDGPLGAGDVGTIPKLVRHLERVLRAEVLATKEAWTSTAAVAPARTIAAALDGLQAAGIRWTVRDGALYLIK